MKFIVVVGTSGAGKSTLGEILVSRLGVTMIEPDHYMWLPNWVSTTPQQFRALIDDAQENAAHTGWVFTGNYRVAQDIIWSKADTMIWLDYSFPVVMWRVIKRTINRVVTKEDLWGTGNRETFAKSFLSKDSIILWAVTTYRRRRRGYSELFRQPPQEYAHINFIRFRSPHETEQWLSTLE